MPHIYGPTSSTNIPAVLTTDQAGAFTPNPAAGQHYILTKSDGLYIQKPDGTLVGPMVSGGTATGILTVINVKTDYGATGNGTTDDTTAISNAIAAIPAAGAILYFPPGTYKTSGGFTLANPTTVLGGGPSDRYGSSGISMVYCTSSTAVLFTVTAKTSQFLNIGLHNSFAGTPTAGSGIQVSGSDVNQCVSYDNVSVSGFYIDIDIQVGNTWVMNNCLIYAPVSIGVKINNTSNIDTGDWCISNCIVASVNYNAGTAIDIVGSGGGKIINTKINSGANTFTDGIALAPTGNTAILLIDNCSIENITGSNIHVDVGSHVFNEVQISNCEFQTNGTGTTHNILMSATTLGNLRYILINNCTLLNPSSTGAAINLTNIETVRIDMCIAENNTLLAQSGCSDVIDYTAGSGTVTSVALTVPSDESVSGSPITSSGTLAITRNSQTANEFLASPNGSSGVPSYRAIVPADVPVMVASGASHAAGLAPDPGGTAGTAKYLREDATWATPAGGGGGGSNISTTTKSYYQRTVLYDSTLGSDTANFDVSSIDQTYDHLELYVFLRTDNAATGDNIQFLFNNDTTAADYDFTDLYAAGSVAGGFNANNLNAAISPGNTATAGDFGPIIGTIQNYAGSNRKVLQLRNSSPNTDASLMYDYSASSIWKSTSAINRITVKMNSGTHFKTGSRFQIIGIKAETLVTSVSGTGTVQATNSSSGTVANTASETTLTSGISGSTTFAANSLGSAGRMLRIKAWGYLSDTGTPTLELKFKLGTTVILDSTAITLASGFSNKLWWFEGVVTVQVTGASGKVIAQGQFYQNGTTTDIVNTAQASIDTTTSKIADLTAQWGTANPSNTITCTNLLLEVLN